MKVTIVYTMKGCPYCTQIKEEFTNNNILFIERDIDVYEEEYEEFSKKTNNEYLPALMLLTLDDKDEPYNVKLLAPDRDYGDIYEGLEMVKKYILD